MDSNGVTQVAQALSAVVFSGGLKCRLFFVRMLVIAALSLSSQCTGQSVLSPDAVGLLAFKFGADPSGTVTASWVGSDPCINGTESDWRGIKCNSRGRVASVTLDNVNLNGTFPEHSLSLLTEVKSIRLSLNQFSGAIPDLSNCSGLLLLWLSNNEFSGPLPNFLMHARKIVNLDLSQNSLEGPVPDLTGASSLLFLDLSDNFLSGIIPPLNNPTLRSFDVSNNKLQGGIPPSLSKFPVFSFSGNAELCGAPLPTDCPIISNDAPPDTEEISSRVETAKPPVPDAAAPVAAGEHKKKKHLGLVAVIAIVVGDTLVILMLIVTFLIYYWRKYSRNVDEKPHLRSAGKTKSSTGDSQSSAQFSSVRDTEAEASKLVFFSVSQQRFELEDLLRASAEMLGKGSFGTAYKAVLENGFIVAVKRLKDLKNDVGRSDFEKHMELLGQLNHPNLVSLRAYYYAKEEKLLVYDYMANGNLFSMLHGNRDSGRTPLDWTSRLRIAREVAIGLAYLHQEWESKNLFHGNIKSSNILVGKNYEICISDVGLVALMNPMVAAHRMAGYRAPEYSRTNRITHQADVYSFGVVLLELLTGRQPDQSHQPQGEGFNLPKWVDSVVREEWTAEVFDLEMKSFMHGEEEMVSLLQIAMACVTGIPEQRPTMSQVVKLIEDIRPVDSFEASESFDREDFSYRDSPFNP